MASDLVKAVRNLNLNIVFTLTKYTVYTVYSEITIRPDF